MKKGLVIILFAILILLMIVFAITIKAISLAIWLIVSLLVAAGVGYLYYRRLTEPIRTTKKELERRKQQDAASEPPLIQQPIQQTPKSPKPPERKYRPAPVYKPIARPRHAHGRTVDAIRREHARLSGEEVFHRLKRHTRRRRRRR
ncbi:hypothetical protein CMO88_00815 [Candidatus Woesearchaeota archaeon]|nr:hypothetical protein [Candidatus Woesearchaeota archaeon]